MTSLDLIAELPGELQARLEEDDYFVDIPVVVSEDANVLAELQKKQAVVTSKTGKRGVAVFVLQIIADEPNTSGNPFAYMSLSLAFQVVENLELNRGQGGTLKKARQVARRIRDVIRCTRLEGLVSDFYGDKPCIDPLKLEDMPANIVAYQVNFKCFETPGELPQQVQAPVPAVAGDQLTFTCATVGATIYYTTDGSYPRAANTAATAYSGPITLPDTGYDLRACAYLTDHIASYVISASVTPD